MKCFFEIDEKEQSRNIFQVGIGNNIIDQTNIFCNRTASENRSDCDLLDPTTQTLDEKW